MSMHHDLLQTLVAPPAPIQGTSGFPAWAIILLMVAVVVVAGIVAFNKTRSK